ncbi:cytochrome b-c1 complex subunit 6, mitochondrial-like [Bolinopsis microptera]|uniref:cytochrome b-c1 complex subunit 6, mitochondrial-like n=1 Tax=Bolinopsis microptera TaxID=2820187 RepID=UPI0030797507
MSELEFDDEVDAEEEEEEEVDAEEAEEEEAADEGAGGEEDDDDDDDEDDDDDDEDDEEDLVDPLVTERERCINSFDCHGFRHALEACNARVKDEGIQENCTPEFFDLLECRDKCVAHGDIFKTLLK